MFLCPVPVIRAQGGRGRIYHRRTFPVTRQGLKQETLYDQQSGPGWIAAVETTKLLCKISYLSAECVRFHPITLIHPGSVDQSEDKMAVLLTRRRAGYFQSDQLCCGDKKSAERARAESVDRCADGRY